MWPPRTFYCTKWCSLRWHFQIALFAQNPNIFSLLSYKNQKQQILTSERKLREIIAYFFCRSINLVISSDWTWSRFLPPVFSKNLTAEVLQSIRPQTADVCWQLRLQFFLLLSSRLFPVSVHSCLGVIKPWDEHIVFFALVVWLRHHVGYTRSNVKMFPPFKCLCRSQF